MFLGAVGSWAVRTGELRPWSPANILKRFGRSRLARTTAEGNVGSAEDAYLLVLLAEQELAAGREDQACSLIEAAYNAFDRRIQDQLTFSTYRKLLFE